MAMEVKNTNSNTPGARNTAERTATTISSIGIQISCMAMSLDKIYQPPTTPDLGAPPRQHQPLFASIYIQISCMAMSLRKNTCLKLHRSSGRRRGNRYDYLPLSIYKSCMAMSLHRNTNIRLRRSSLWARRRRSRCDYFQYLYTNILYGDGGKK